MVWRVAAILAAVVTVVTAATDSKTTSSNIKMEDTIKDLYHPPPEGQQGRFFLNYDQSAAFNSSVAFTIPLFSFTLPGAADSAAAGMDGETFGALAFIALFLLGGLGVALYTTSQGSTFRSGTIYQEESFLTRLVTESLAGIPNIVDAESCARLAICGAHADPQRYGLLAFPFKLFFPVPQEIPEEEMTSYQRASRDGASGVKDCQYEYPCLFQPLDILIYIYDYWYGDDSL